MSWCDQGNVPAGDWHEVESVQAGCEVCEIHYVTNCYFGRAYREEWICGPPSENYSYDHAYSGIIADITAALPVGHVLYSVNMHSTSGQYDDCYILKTLVCDGYAYRGTW